MNKISTRLAISFLIVALLPALPLSLVVRDLLDRRFGPGIADPLELALESGLTESRVHLRELKADLDRQIQLLEITPENPPMVLLDSLGRVQSADSLAIFLKESPSFLNDARDLDYSRDKPRNIRRLNEVLVGVKLSDSDSRYFVCKKLPAGMVQRAGNLTEGVSLLRLVRGQESRVLSSFVGPFVVVYSVLIGVALLVGVLWSRQIIRPLGTLVSSTRRVAKGDLEFRIPDQGPGEMGELVRSFDSMVGHLHQQRRDLSRLERAAAWRGMARTLAHEIKNPLTPILLAVNQARDSYHGEDEKYQNLLNEVSEIVGEEVESLRRLVREFGDFARLPKPEPRPGDLGELVRDLEHLYGTGKVKLVVGDLPTECWFDFGALRRGLINLIDNGLAACHDAGTTDPLILRAESVGKSIHLAVEDAGTGINPDHMKRIFEPDFTTKSGGMGLGLAIVENIILGHGGNISVNSQLGLGTAFKIELPLGLPISPPLAGKDESP